MLVKIQEVQKLINKLIFPFFNQKYVLENKLIGGEQVYVKEEANMFFFFFFINQKQFSWKKYSDLYYYF